jgi:hypothetical protein
VPGPIFAQPKGKGGKKFEKEVPPVVVLEITTALGVEAKVNVVRVENEKIMNSTASEDKFVLELSTGVYLWIPWEQVVTFQAKDKSHVVLLKDGSAYLGSIKTKVISDERKLYSLENAQKIKLVSARQGNPLPPFELQSRMIHVHKPTSQSFVLYSFFSPISIGESSPEYFRMRVGGTELDGNFSDFEKIAMTKKDNRWHISVKAPGAKEVQGAFWRDRFMFIGRLVNGLALVLDSTNPGFTLERKKEVKDK